MELRVVVLSSTRSLTPETTHTCQSAQVTVAVRTYPPSRRKACGCGDPPLDSRIHGYISSLIRARCTGGTSSTKCLARASPNDSGWRAASPCSLAKALTVFFVASVVRQLALSPVR
jgi:hypothetical protein